ncbi:4-alpha-glucanotransferase [Oxalobacteraceae bacterium R-40]|uniref:4-alpha-glucanotransferase n=1 Tax=Keguizhuia sedimenti TaxID=3064264 RepID=A0ABU1BPY0_9BURK|nr:4-alpha-glucanotransferase [Oxalobacteraceae bacterium R-40]
MIEQDLRRLADAAGIQVEWTDAFGKRQTVAPDTLKTILNALELPCADAGQLRDSLARRLAENARTTLLPLLTCTAGLPVPLSKDLDLQGKAYRIEFEHGGTIDGRFAGDVPEAPSLLAPQHTGYHRLLIDDQPITLAVAPPRCFSVGDALADNGGPEQAIRRPWGISAQLYSLRRKGDGGIGDFTALKTLAEAAARHGASALAISPVHAMFSGDTNRFSPYSPSSRLFFNALHIDPAVVLGEQALRQVLQQTGQAESYARYEQLELIDWPNAARLKLDILRQLFQQFRQNPASGAEFEQFCREGGQALLDHARFEALHAHFSSGSLEGVSGYWPSWPDAFRDPRSAEVASFAEAHSDEVQFHLFLQWQAAKGLSSAQKAARNAGMQIGLISDLAVGADNGGSQAWSRQKELLKGFSVGAPPDNLNALGQSWGLGAFSPHALKQHGFGAYIEMLRSAFAHSGGVRIDHVLGLMRMWLVPEGMTAQHGAYLRYPMDDLVRLIALESWRHRAIVIGEDLGTIPEGFGDRMAQAGLMGIRVLLFQRDHGYFIPPEHWAPHAIATTTTHDTPSLAGWWAGHDIDWRSKLDLREPGNSEEAEREQRTHERMALWNAMRHAGCAHGELPSPAPEHAPLNEAASFLGRSMGPLAILPLEDALGLPEQPNLPGTVDTHPNWRRRMPHASDSLLDLPEAATRLALLNKARSHTREST